MGFDQFRKAELEPGHTVPMVLDMLPGEPVIHVEHLGETNSTYLDDEIARANAKPASAGGKGQQKISKVKLAEIRTKRRATLAKHVIRKLEAKHSDGKPATVEDIPLFVDSIPGDVVDTIWNFANNAENFRPSLDDVKDLAEK